jgi:uncharacterized membrane protein YkoI
MKTLRLIHTAIFATCLALFASGCATSSGKPSAQAKITRAQAEQTALAQVPGGKIAEGELEKEHGKLVWSFDIATPGNQDITEMQVDALTGRIVSRETETPEQQAKEAKHK